jgi:hypothetical protein
LGGQTSGAWFLAVDVPLLGVGLLLVSFLLLPQLRAQESGAIGSLLY